MHSADPVAYVLPARVVRHFYFTGVDKLQSVEIQRVVSTWQEQTERQRRRSREWRQQQLAGGSPTALVPVLQLGSRRELESGRQFAVFINSGVFELKGDTMLVYLPRMGTQRGNLRAAAAVRPMTQQDIEALLKKYAAPQARDSGAKRPARQTLQQEQQPA